MFRSSDSFSLQSLYLSLFSNFPGMVTFQQYFVSSSVIKHVQKSLFSLAEGVTAGN